MFTSNIDNAEELKGKRIQVFTPDWGRMIAEGTCTEPEGDKHFWFEYDNGQDTGFSLNDGIKIKIVE
jgi:hypothetical protein